MYSSLLASSTLVVWKALESYGCDSEALFAQAGLDPAHLHDPNARYEYEHVRKLWELAVETTGDPCFSLTAAQFWHPSHFHALGFSWLASASLEDALQRLMRYFRIVTTDPEQLSLEETDEGFEFIVDTSVVQYRGLDEEYDLFFAIVVDACRVSFPEKFSPLRVSLQREAPSCADRFEEFFQAPVTFSAAQNILVFRKEDLTTRLPTGNAELARTNDQVIRHYLSYLDRSDVVMQVKTSLIDQLPSGQVNEESVADALNMSMRTLQRKLHEEGVTYKQLLDETRHELAMQYIHESRSSVSEIAYLLGFSEVSNFSRAFKRWTGASPTEFRLAE